MSSSRSASAGGFPLPRALAPSHAQMRTWQVSESAATPAASVAAPPDPSPLTSRLYTVTPDGRIVLRETPPPPTGGMAAVVAALVEINLRAYADAFDAVGYDDLLQATTGIMARFGGGLDTPEEEEGGEEADGGGDGDEEPDHGDAQDGCDGHLQGNHWNGRGHQWHRQHGQKHCDYGK